MKINPDVADHILRVGFTSPVTTRPPVTITRAPSAPTKPLPFPIGFTGPKTRPLVGPDGAPLPIGVQGPGTAPGESSGAGTTTAVPPQAAPAVVYPSSQPVQTSTTDDAAREAIGQLQQALAQAQQDHSDQAKQMQAQIDQLTTALQTQAVKHSAIVQWLINEWHKAAAYLHHGAPSAQGVTPPSQQTVNGYSRFR